MNDTARDDIHYLHADVVEDESIHLFVVDVPSAISLANKALTTKLNSKVNNNGLI